MPDRGVAGTAGGDAVEIAPEPQGICGWPGRSHRYPAGALRIGGTQAGNRLAGVQCVGRCHTSGLRFTGRRGAFSRVARPPPAVGSNGASGGRDAVSRPYAGCKQIRRLEALRLRAERMPKTAVPPRRDHTRYGGTMVVSHVRLFDAQADARLSTHWPTRQAS